MGKIIKSFAAAVVMVTMLFSNAAVAQAGEWSTEALESSTKADMQVLQRKVVEKECRFTGRKETYMIGSVEKTSASSLTLEMKKDDNQNLVQGTIYFSAFPGGKSVSLKYANYANDTYTVDLSNVPDGRYTLSIDGFAVGSSGKAIVNLSYKE